MGRGDTSQSLKMYLRKGEILTVRLWRTVPVVAAQIDWMRGETNKAAAQCLREYTPSPPFATMSVAIVYAYDGKSGACAAVWRTVQVNLLIQIAAGITSCVGLGMLEYLCCNTHQHSCGRAFSAECSGCKAGCTLGGRGGRKTPLVYWFWPL
eukprot:24479-Ditylum_brightwellii.AAC.1